MASVAIQTHLFLPLPSLLFLHQLPPKISIISVAAFVRACAEDGAQQYTLQPSAPSISGMASSTAPPDMTEIPAEYHDFADVFSDSLSEKLPEHRPYDLKINIEEGTSPLLGPIYSLSVKRLCARKLEMQQRRRH